MSTASSTDVQAIDALICNDRNQTAIATNQREMWKKAHKREFDENSLNMVFKYVNRRLNKRLSKRPLL